MGTGQLRHQEEVELPKGGQLMGSPWMTRLNKRKVLEAELWEEKSLQKKGSFKWSLTESEM